MIGKRIALEVLLSLIIGTLAAILTTPIVESISGLGGMYGVEWYRNNWAITVGGVLGAIGCGMLAFNGWHRTLFVILPALLISYIVFLLPVGDPHISLHFDDPNIHQWVPTLKFALHMLTILSVFGSFVGWLLRLAVLASE